MNKSLLLVTATLIVLGGLSATYRFIVPTPAPVVEDSCLTASTNEMVFVPAGSFVMGADDMYPEESPAHAVSISAFSISSTEVTNAQFSKFVEATGYITIAEQRPLPEHYPNIPPEYLKPGSALFVPPTDLSRGGNPLNLWQFIEGASWQHPEGPNSSIKGREDHPVVHVALQDAQAYAAWRGHRLPTEAEYEYASRGGLTDKRYAWGDSLAPGGVHKANTWQGTFPFHNSREDGYPALAPVGCYEANGYGLYDMIGNVWEWTSSRYQPTHAIAESASEDGYDPRQPGVPVAVIKGGSYLCAPSYCIRYRPAARHAQDTGLGTGHIGFRTVADILPST